MHKFRTGKKSINWIQQNQFTTVGPCISGLPLDNKDNSELKDCFHLFFGILFCSINIMELFFFRSLSHLDFRESGLQLY